MVCSARRFNRLSFSRSLSSILLVSCYVSFGARAQQYIERMEGMKSRKHPFYVQTNTLLSKMNAESKYTLINKRCPGGGAHFPLCIFALPQCSRGNKANEHVTRICVNGSLYTLTLAHTERRPNSKRTKKRGMRQNQRFRIYLRCGLTTTPMHQSTAYIRTIYTHTYKHTSGHSIVRNSWQSFGSRDRRFISTHLELVE